ncbi:hypothetical protein Tco_0215628 [Tanacetum coccineum]
MMYERPPTTPFQNSPRNTSFPFQNNSLMFQQHQDESPYDAWTRFKNLIQRVPHHVLNLWSLTQFFYDHVDRYTKIDINHVAGGNLRRLSVEEAWETIEDYAQFDKQYKNPTSTISDQTIANLKAQLVENKVVTIKIPKCMSWLDDKPIGDLDMMEDKVDNPCPQSTPQVLTSFEVYTPPVTYLEELDETIGISMEVEPLDHMKLEDLGLNTRSHDLFLSSREIPSVDKPEPQLLPNFSPLDVNLEDKRGTDPPINPYSLSSFRMKEFLKKKNFFIDPGDGVRINLDGVATPATGKFDF